MTEQERTPSWDTDEEPRIERADALPIAPVQAVPNVDPDSEDAKHEHFMEIARKVMRDHRNVLAALAK